MTRLRKLLVPLCALLCWATTSQTLSGAIATWNFDSGAQNLTALTGTHTTSYTANYDANTRDTVNLTAAKVTTVTLGSETANQTAGTGLSGVGLQFTANTGSSKAVNGSSFVISLTTSSQVASLGSLVITYSCLSSGSDAGNVNAWTLAGATAGNGTVNGVFSARNGSGQWDTVTVTFTGVNVGPNTTFTLTDALSGYANGSGSTAVFDNISFSASVTPVPEPINLALAGFGMGIVVIGVARRVYGWVRS